MATSGYGLPLTPDELSDRLTAIHVLAHLLRRNNLAAVGKSVTSKAASEWLGLA